jgi:GDP-mannose 6-dehydrogenase
MRIAVFGLGYVGTVSAACFAKNGHSVIGVDSLALKVELIAQGRAPIIESGLSELVSETTQAGRLQATVDSASAVEQSELSLVCVGTPSLPNGSLDVRSLIRVCEEIGAALRQRSAFHTVVIRSTVLPGTMRKLIRPALEAASGKRAGVDFGLASHPEFMREGTAIKDFYDPPHTVIGGIDERSAESVASLYAGMDIPLTRTTIEVAEMIKYAANAWHALKVAFGNEIGNLCKSLEIDSHEVMDIFCTDRKLNVSTAYLKPGFAFGGSCLPKDLRALTYMAKTLDLTLPVLGNVMASNRQQIDRAVERIMAMERRRIGVLGISFKAGTDDLRESPIVEVVERLIGKGCDVRLFDRNVSLARLVGANREYVLRTIPHIDRLFVDDVSRVLEHAEIIIIGNGDPEFHAVPATMRPDQYLIDMVRIPDGKRLADRYDGINW